MIQADTCESSDIGSGGDGLILRSVITTLFFRKTLRLLITDSQNLEAAGTPSNLLAEWLLTLHGQNSRASDTVVA